MRKATDTERGTYFGGISAAEFVRYFAPNYGDLDPDVPWLVLVELPTRMGRYGTGCGTVRAIDTDRHEAYIDYGIVGYWVGIDELYGHLLEARPTR